MSESAQTRIEEALFLFRRPEEGASEHYDRVTRRFHAETGIHAPGRSVPDAEAASQPSRETRRERYNEWKEERIERARGVLKSGAVGKLQNALEAAYKHLEWCGYGDSYERERARENGLQGQIEDALEAAGAEVPR